MKSPAKQRSKGFKHLQSRRRIQAAFVFVCSMTEVNLVLGSWVHNIV